MNLSVKGLTREQANRKIDTYLANEQTNYKNQTIQLARTLENIQTLINLKREINS